MQQVWQGEDLRKIVPSRFLVIAQYAASQRIKATSISLMEA
jgi:hypothetical protein